MKLPRTGIGFDVHRLEKGNELFLGGISIPSDLQAVGHSDADVLLHAIADALLGAAALGDIGGHFPDNDPAYKNIYSGEILKEVANMLYYQGYEIGNVDAVVALQKPKLSPHIQNIRASIAEILQQPLSNVSVKATTTEKLGFIGREEGIAAYATTLIFEKA